MFYSLNFASIFHIYVNLYINAIIGTQVGTVTFRASTPLTDCKPVLVSALKLCTGLIQAGTATLVHTQYTNRKISEPQYARNTNELQRSCSTRTSRHRNPSSMIELK